LTDPADLRDLVRIESGNPSTNEVSDDVIATKLVLTLRKIRRAMPNAGSEETFTIDKFVLVAGTQAYDIPADRVIDEVWYEPIDPGLFLPSSPTQPFSNIPVLFNPGTYYRSDELIAEIQRAQMRARYDYEILNGKVYFDPVPDGSIAYAYYSYRDESEESTPTTYPLTFAQSLIDGATAAVCDLLANRANRQFTGIGGQGLVDKNRGPDYARMAEKYAQRFKDSLLELAMDNA